jgi:hypothetical protein
MTEEQATTLAWMHCTNFDRTIAKQNMVVVFITPERGAIIHHDGTYQAIRLGQLHDAPGKNKL